MDKPLTFNERSRPKNLEVIVSVFVKRNVRHYESEIEISDILHVWCRQILECFYGYVPSSQPLFNDLVSFPAW